MLAGLEDLINSGLLLFDSDGGGGAGGRGGVMKWSFGAVVARSYGVFQMSQIDCCVLLKFC